MNAHIKNYLNSFHVKGTFLKTFLLDGATFAFTLLLWLAFGKLLTVRASAISAGKSVEELKSLILTGGMEANQALLGNLKAFVFSFIFGSILVVILTVMLFSLSRMMVWDKVIKRKFSWKRLASWNGLVLVTTLLSLLYILIFGIIKMITNLLTTSLGETTYLLLVRTTNYTFFLALITFIFIVFYSFTESHKVWKSVGNAFHLLKVRWNRLWRMFLLVVATGVVVGFFVSYIQRYFFRYPPLIYSIVSIGIMLLFISWMRLYLLKTFGYGYRETHQ